MAAHVVMVCSGIVPSAAEAALWRYPDGGAEAPPLQNVPFSFASSTSIHEIQGFLRSRWSVEMTGIWGRFVSATFVSAIVVIEQFRPHVRLCQREFGGPSATLQDDAEKRATAKTKAMAFAVAVVASRF